jgi:hypothetical protein
MSIENAAGPDAGRQRNWPAIPLGRETRQFVDALGPMNCDVAQALPACHFHGGRFTAHLKAT